MTARNWSEVGLRAGANFVSVLTLNWNLAVIIYSFSGINLTTQSLTLGWKKNCLRAALLWPWVPATCWSQGCRGESLAHSLSGGQMCLKMLLSYFTRETLYFNVPFNFNGVEWLHLPSVFTVTLLCTKIPFFSVQSRPQKFPQTTLHPLTSSIPSPLPLPWLRSHHLSLSPELVALPSPHVLSLLDSPHLTTVHCLRELFKHWSEPVTLICSCSNCSLLFQHILQQPSHVCPAPHGDAGFEGSLGWVVCESEPNYELVNPSKPGSPSKRFPLWFPSVGNLWLTHTAQLLDLL